MRYAAAGFIGTAVLLPLLLLKGLFWQNSFKPCNLNLEPSYDSFDFCFLLQGWQGLGYGSINHKMSWTLCVYFPLISCLLSRFFSSMDGRLQPLRMEGRML